MHPTQDFLGRTSIPLSHPKGMEEVSLLDVFVLSQDGSECTHVAIMPETHLDIIIDLVPSPCFTQAIES